MINFIYRMLKQKIRKDQRFIVGDCDIIIYDQNSPEEKEIADLSLGGISIVYEDNGKRLKKVFELEIKIGDVDNLGKMRVKTISDVKIGEITSGNKIIRKLSARFINLNALQKYELRRILKKSGKKFKI